MPGWKTWLLKIPIYMCLSFPHMSLATFVGEFSALNLKLWVTSQNTQGNKTNINLTGQSTEGIHGWNFVPQWLDFCHSQGSWWLEFCSPMAGFISQPRWLVGWLGSQDLVPSMAVNMRLYVGKTKCSTWLIYGL